MARVALILALAASLASGCVRPIFDGRSVSGTAAVTTPAGAPDDARGSDPVDDAHTRRFGI